MRTLCTALLAGTLLLAPGLWAKDKKETSVSVDSKKLGYAIGSEIGHNVKPIAGKLDIDSLVAGLKDTLAGGKMAYTEEELAQVTREFTRQMHEEQTAGQKDLAEKNAKEGDAFLAANGKKEGWQTTESGLQIKFVTKGDGPKPKKGDRVKVHYKGTLIDGTEFDSSYKRGEPITFGVTQVIAGWVEALQMMPVGSKVELAIPGDLAYGPQGSGGQIGPNATLLFTVELLGIEK